MSVDGGAADDIVLVDDDPLVGEFVRRVLRGSGRRLRTFDDPRAAAAHLAGHTSEVLVVDTRMPGMGGTELLETLARDGHLDGTRVILCSASRRRLVDANRRRDDGERDTLPPHEWLSKDELLDRHTLLARLGGPRTTDFPSAA